MLAVTLVYVDIFLHEGGHVFALVCLLVGVPACRQTTQIIMDGF